MDEADHRSHSHQESPDTSPELLGGSASYTDLHTQVNAARAGPPTPGHLRRASSFAQPRTGGTPRTPNRVRFDVDEFKSKDAIAPARWSEEDDDPVGLGIEHEPYVDGQHGGQRLPLLTGIEAPGVTMACEDDEFNPEDLLESARPKSGMSSAFMNMANSIMYVPGNG